MSTRMGLVRLYAIILVIWMMLLVGLGPQIGPLELFIMLVVSLTLGTILTRRILKQSRDQQP